jgi:GNAT superfamily N-acetyltransferase
MTHTIVRAAAQGDAPSIAALMGMLGYPTDEGAMRGRLERILADPGYATFVAERAGAVIGMVGVMRGVAYNSDQPFARIVALVVDDQARGSGAGAALVRAAEKWAREQGAASIHLTTASHRDGAHAFYSRVGYQATGTRFHRRLD